MTGTDVPELVFKEAFEAPEYANLILFGPMGSGKSTGAATAPGPILWLNAQGEGSIRFPRIVAGKRGTRILEVELPKRDADYQQILRETLRYIKRGTEPRVKTVVVDTIGNVRDLLAKQKVVGPNSKTRDQWGDVVKILREFVLELRDEPVNLVLLAHESVEDADDDRIVRPKIGGVLTEDIPAECDIVAYCGVMRDLETGEKRYEGQFVESKGRRCKDRSNGLGEHRPIDLTEWLERYREALTPDDSDLPFVENEADLKPEERVQTLDEALAEEHGALGEAA